jgi:hypothetical protein
LNYSRRKKEEGRRKKEEGRRPFDFAQEPVQEEGRRKKEEGPSTSLRNRFRKKEEGSQPTTVNIQYCPTY